MKGDLSIGQCDHWWVRSWLGVSSGAVLVRGRSVLLLVVRSRAEIVTMLVLVLAMMTITSTGVAVSRLLVATRWSAVVMLTFLQNEIDSESMVCLRVAKRTNVS